ncbi:MAG: redoxin protein [Ferruginibacter sp.]|nr:redoxin protein [Ferruginibacter sp.]
MKITRAIFSLLILAISFNSFGQATDSLPVYQRFPTVPPFSIMRYPDSTKFVKDDLKEKQPVLVMVFSPDCDHCQHATEDLLRNMDKFKKVQIVMGTPLAYNFIKPFYDKYELSKYPNIFIGWDASYFLGTFYGVRNYPSLYLYDKKGKFVKGYEGSVSFAKIAEDL